MNMPIRNFITVSLPFARWAVRMATILYNEGSGANYDPLNPGSPLDIEPGYLDHLGNGSNDEVEFANNLLLFLRSVAGTLAQLIRQYDDELGSVQILTGIDEEI